MSEGLCVENEDRFDLDNDKLSRKTILHNINIRTDALIPDMSLNTALLVLNQKITLPLPLFIKLWDSHKLRVCADGAANRLYEYLKAENIQNKYVPDYIIGDLDSLKEEIYMFYRSLGVVIIKQTTQYSTDFTKSVNVISLHMNSIKFIEIIGSDKNSYDNNFGISLDKGVHDLYDELKSQCETGPLCKINLLAIGGIGGRFDQTIHSITQLHVLTETDSNFELFYLTETDLIMLIPKNGTLIEYNDEKFRENCIGNCGLLPIGKKTVINETYGLKWDVNQWITSISSGRVSTNNRFAGNNQCYIDVQDDIVINIEIFIDKLLTYF